MDAARGDRPWLARDFYQGRTDQARLSACLYAPHRPAGTLPNQRAFPLLPRCTIPALVPSSAGPGYRYLVDRVGNSSIDRATGRGFPWAGAIAGKFLGPGF